VAGFVIRLPSPTSQSSLVSKKSGMRRSSTQREPFRKPGPFRLFRTLSSSPQSFTLLNSFPYLSQTKWSPVFFPPPKVTKPRPPLLFHLNFLPSPICRETTSSRPFFFWSISSRPTSFRENLSEWADQSGFPTHAISTFVLNPHCPPSVEWGFLETCCPSPFYPPTSSFPVQLFSYPDRFPPLFPACSIFLSSPLLFVRSNFTLDGRLS